MTALLWLAAAFASIILVGGTTVALYDGLIERLEARRHARRRDERRSRPAVEGGYQPPRVRGVGGWQGHVLSATGPTVPVLGATRWSGAGQGSAVRCATDRNRSAATADLVGLPHVRVIRRPPR